MGILIGRKHEQEDLDEYCRSSKAELICTLHMAQIRHALGVLGVEAVSFPWTSWNTSPGVQIDMVVERADNVTNICEVKYADDVYAMRE